jgi:hypothetical protein
MHFIISQEPLYTEIYMKNAPPHTHHPDQAPAFKATVRTPQCGHTVWGIKKENLSRTSYEVSEVDSQWGQTSGSIKQKYHAGSSLQGAPLSPFAKPFG